MSFIRQTCLAYILLLTCSVLCNGLLNAETFVPYDVHQVNHEPIEQLDGEQATSFQGNTDFRSLILGGFFGLMVVMAVYNLFLFFSLKDRAYLLYVGVVVFNILTLISVNGLGHQYLWPAYANLDGIIYITFAGLSMFCSSRFAAVFLKLKELAPRLNQFMWLIAGLSLLLTLLSLFLTIEQITPFGRWLVLLSFPSYLVVGSIIYRKGFKPAFYYLIAWIPYILALVVRTLHGAGWLADSTIVMSSLEIGGSLEVALLSFALADRIKALRKELTEKELEKERFMTLVLSEQKELLEKTVQERTRELEVANETKDRFFSIIAHDLRSPMIALQGVGQKLEYFIKKDKQEKLLELGAKIDQSIDQLNHLLNNLLNWASSQTDGIPYNPESTDLKELVEENISLYKSLAKSKNVRLINGLSKCYAFVDVNTASTVIRNILSNAIKFSPENGKVMFSASENKGFIELSISDEGKGMNEDERLLAQAGEMTRSNMGTRNEKGFGLGLKLCKEFVFLNQGTLAVESEPEKGTKFIVRFPVRG